MQPRREVVHRLLVLCPGGGRAGCVHAQAGGRGRGGLCMKTSFITLSLGVGEEGTTDDQHPEAHLL